MKTTVAIFLAFLAFILILALEVCLYAGLTAIILWLLSLIFGFTWAWWWAFAFGIVAMIGKSLLFPSRRSDSK